MRFHDEQMYTISKEDREEHELLGHVQYRSWCRHCAAARGVGQQHRQLREDPVDGTVPEIVLDYYFMGVESETAPHIVVKDRKSSAYFSTSLDSKTSPRHCANLMTRFKRHPDGRTAIKRPTGRRWGRPMVVFGERILVKVAVSRAGRRAGLESAFTPAVYVGHHGRSGALMALTEHGVNGSLEAERLDRPLIAGTDALGVPILPVPAGMPTLPPKMQERRMYVTSADVRKYGGSEGCQACTQVYTCCKTNVPHSDACRRRIQELMKGDDVGRARLDASTKRKAISQAFERDAPPMPGVRQELGPGDQSLAQEELTRHGGGDDVEIPAAHGSGDPDQSRMDGNMSGGASSSSGQGLKRTAGQAGLPENADISHPQGTEQVWRVQGLEWSQTQGDRKLREELPRQRETTQILTFK